MCTALKMFFGGGGGVRVPVEPAGPFTQSLTLVQEKFLYLRIISEVEHINTSR